MRPLLTFTLSLGALVLSSGCDFHSRDHDPAYFNVCRFQLLSIQGAKEAWMSEYHGTTNDVPPDSDLFGAIPALLREKPICPAGGIYTIGKVGAKARCSVAGHSF
jgi:hypothetical protein